MELLTNLVRRVGTRLTELLASRFAMQCNKKFNEMRSPGFCTKISKIWKLQKLPYIFPLWSLTWRRPPAAEKPYFYVEKQYFEPEKTPEAACHRRGCAFR